MQAPLLQVGLVRDARVLGGEVVGLLREVQPERRRPLDQPQDPILGQRWQAAPRRQNFRRSYLAQRIALAALVGGGDVAGAASAARAARRAA